MPLFDRYIAVDWSANNSRKLGEDSIWSCAAVRAADDVQTRNHPTRRGAESWLLQQLETAIDAGERILVGMDFPYGYPAAFAAALGQRGDPWRATWRYLTARVVDDSDNRSNRFEVASDINVALGARAPFWGRPQHLSLPALSARKDVAYHDLDQPDRLPEWREVERTLRHRGASPQPAWKLAYTGGSTQATRQPETPISWPERHQPAQATRYRSLYDYHDHGRQTRCARLHSARPGLSSVVDDPLCETSAPSSPDAGTPRQRQRPRPTARSASRSSVDSEPLSHDPSAADGTPVPLRRRRVSLAQTALPRTEQSSRRRDHLRR